MPTYPPSPHRTVLTLDPSKTATGWAVLRGTKCVDAGCYVFKSQLDKKRSSIDKFWEFNLEYTSFLYDLVRRYWVNEVCSEFPHGSQSYNAAVSLTTVKNIIGSLKPVLEMPVYFYTESDCKKHYFGKAKGIEKSDTVREMSDKFADWNLTLPKADYKKQAICDALLVYTKHDGL